jgi:predicted  nucleic acid-binding Zn-ribbon protein
MDFRCEKCGRRFGQLVKEDTKVVLCPKCGREIDLVALNEIIEEARRSILDRVEGDTNRQEKTREG